MKMCSSMVRGLIIAPEGKKLVVSDYSSIEGRVLAWLAGEQKVLKAYEDVDKGIGYDMYKLTYAKVFGVTPESVTSEQRQIGKPINLAFGYAGGFGAFDKFAKSYNMNLDDIASKITLPGNIYAQAEKYYNYLLETKPPEYCKNTFIMIDGIKRLWRDANPNITQLWSDVQNAVISAVNGHKAIAGMCIFDKKKSWLRIRLPSGRYLCYPNIKHRDRNLYYFGKREKSKGYGEISSYGGKFVENITQAVARDLLAFGMFNATKYGYEIILHVHDEIVAETPDTQRFTHEKLSRYMSILPKWAKGLPLSAAGFEAYRYRKED